MLRHNDFSLFVPVIGILGYQTVDLISGGMEENMSRMMMVEKMRKYKRNSLYYRLSECYDLRGKKRGLGGLSDRPVESVFILLVQGQENCSSVQFGKRCNEFFFFFYGGILSYLGM